MLSLDPLQILTDSLIALQLIQHWRLQPLVQMLTCPDRAEVRHFIHPVSMRAASSLPKKLRAYDSHLIALEAPKSCGNDAAD